MNIRLLAAAAATVLLITACATTDPNDPYAQTKRNAAIGAALGAVAGMFVGDGELDEVLGGAAVGAGVGAGIGLRADHRHVGGALFFRPEGGAAHHPLAQALALVRGRAFVVPDDLQHTAESVLAHRVLLADPLIGDGWEKSRMERAVIRSVVEGTPVPR